LRFFLIKQNGGPVPVVAPVKKAPIKKAAVQHQLTDYEVMCNRHEEKHIGSGCIVH